MLTILVMNGPNLNRLGERESSYYGVLTLKQINQLLKKEAKKIKAKLIFFQSNHEGFLIDFLQKNYQKVNGILINPGALTHYGYSLRDALLDTKLPVVEVHLSDITKREAFRKIDVLEGVAIKRIMGLKEKSYLVGLAYLVGYLKKNKL